MATLPTDRFQDFQDADSFWRDYGDANDVVGGGTGDAGHVGLVGGQTDDTTPNSTLKELFSKTITSAADDPSFHGHPVVKMVINYIQKHVEFRWQMQPLKKTLFPNLDETISPQYLDPYLKADTGGGLDPIGSPFLSYASGLVTKAIYNANPDYDENISTDKFNQEVASLNTHLNSHLTLLLVSYIRHVCRLSVSDTNVNKYKGVLLSDTFRTNRRSLAVSGGWHNASIEMYAHYVKLTACGASEDTVKEVHRKITTEEPKIEAAWFAGFSIDNWKGFRDWMYSGTLDFGDLNAQNANHSYWVWSPGFGPNAGMNVQMRLCIDWTRDMGYLKPRNSSCFAGNTKVLLADGVTTRRLDQMSVGDEVLSLGFDAQPTEQRKRVAFVTRTSAAGRPLYSLKPYNGIAFTSTHPIVQRSTEHEFPVLTFVHPDIAASLNPSWQSLLTRSLDKCDLHEVLSSTNNSIDDPLYDLLLEPNSNIDTESGPATYVVVSSEGQRLEVASEAPVLEWFPHAAEFFRAFLRALELDSHSPSEMINKINRDGFHVRSLLREAAKEVHDMEHKKQTLASAESWPSIYEHLASASDPYATTKLLESLIARLGRTINDVIHTTWSRTIPVCDGDVEPVIFLHTLRVLEPFVGPTVCTASTVNVSIFSEDKLIYDDSIPIEREGHQSMELQRAISLDMTSAPKNVGEDNLILLEVQLQHSQLETLTLRGRVHIREGNVMHVAMASHSPNAHAVLTVQYMKVSRQEMRTHQMEDAPSQTGLSATAVELGIAFARRLIAA